MPDFVWYYISGAVSSPTLLAKWLGLDNAPCVCSEWFLNKSQLTALLDWRVWGLSVVHFFVIEIYALSIFSVKIS